MSGPTSEEVREALKDVFDPELGYNIVDLGMVYGIDIEGSKVKIRMTLTTPGCPASDMIQAGVEQRLEDMEGVEDVEITLVWEPPWSPKAMSPEARKHFGSMDED